MKHRPAEIRIELTNVCNTNCVMCPRELMKNPYGTMTNEIFHQVVDEAVDLEIPTLVLCGFGELFMDKQYADKIAYLKKKKPSQHVSMTSNGSKIDEATADFLAQCPWINTIRISISGFYPETYRQIMRLDREMIYNNMTTLRHKLKAYRSPTKLRINAIHIPDVYKEGELEAFIRYWEENCDLLEVWKAHNWTSAYSYRGSDIPEVASCGRPANGPIEVMWNGQYKICCFDFDGREILGRFPDTSLRDFWELPRLKHIQALHAKAEFESLPTCKDCDQIYAAKKDILVYSNAGVDPEERVQLTGDLSAIDSGQDSAA